ncbi:MAG: hypothetical protein R3C53_09610 [Pirellulaceae bacterium]
MLAHAKRSAVIAVLFLQSLSVAQQTTPAKSADAYAIRYKLQPGQTLVSKVSHFAETKTRMAEHDEASSSRTISTKVWEVQSVDADGNMTFEYRIDAVNLAQSVGDGEELKYNSQTDAEAPDVFRSVAETISKPLATVTINPQGQVIARDKESLAPVMGIGELTLPLPADPVAIGGQWNVPRELRVKLESGSFKTIKVRELYTLEKVSAGVATIRVETQPLTPVNDPAVESQLIQQLSKGTIKFDLDNGRLISKELAWSDEVVGFRGPDTSLRYDAEWTEELQVEASRTASATTKKR